MTNTLKKLNKKHKIILDDIMNTVINENLPIPPLKQMTKSENSFVTVPLTKKRNQFYLES